MKHQKILNLLNETNDSKFVTRKWNIVNDNSKSNYDATNAIQVAFKNCAPFTKLVTKIDVTTIDDAEDLDLVMVMYNLIECTSNCSETAGSLWFYSKDEATDFNINVGNTNNFKPFKYNNKLLRNREAQADNAANGILKMQQLLCH